MVYTYFPISLRPLLLLGFMCSLVCGSPAQQKTSIDFFAHSDSLNPSRVWLAGGFTLASYSAFSVGLYQAWYSKQKQTNFHFFNDHGEWLAQDKLAHAYNSYSQSALCFQGAKWCGYRQPASLIWANAISLLFQSTVEIMDGFSPDYGFSWPDMAANFLGAGFFTGQQVLWGEQKFRIKLSSWPQSYSHSAVHSSGDPVYSFEDRAKELYGSGFLNSALKDYNAQTYWLSFNPEQIFATDWKWWPSFLNISLGFGADGLFGGFSNHWVKNDVLYEADYIPRKRQYYLSLDLDLSKIKSKSSFFNTLFYVFNIVKIPAPAFEFDSSGKFKAHALYF